VYMLYSEHKQNAEVQRFLSQLVSSFGLIIRSICFFASFAMSRLAFLARVPHTSW